ncbi:MAG: PPA1309 family protein [Actinomycetes bacterium]
MGGVPTIRTRSGRIAPVDTRLTQLALDIERHSSSLGWDQPPHLFALVETADLLRREPQLAGDLGITDGAPGSLTPVDQGDLPDHATLEELLGGITWPPEVLGTALAVERLMVPPAAERDMPQDEGAALSWLAAHPERQEVRIVVAVLRDGSRMAALRMRSHDDEQSILTGADLVPGLADALAATLAD